MIKKITVLDLFMVLVIIFLSPVIILYLIAKLLEYFGKNVLDKIVLYERKNK